MNARTRPPAHVRYASKGPLVLVMALTWATNHRHWDAGRPWIFYGLLAAWGLAFVPWWWAHQVDKQRRRRRAGLCGKCGYSLTGNVSGICPECGTKVG